jgi:8-oxo-dGTP diphosphatase
LGETLQQGVVREVLEETGLVVVPAGIVEVLDRITQDEVLQDGAPGRVRYHYVLVDFVCHVTGGALRVGSDADEVRWVVREELGGYHLAPITVRVIEKALELFR